MWQPLLQIHIINFTENQIPARTALLFGSNYNASNPGLAWMRRWPRRMASRPRVAPKALFTAPCAIIIKSLPYHDDIIMHVWRIMRMVIYARHTLLKKAVRGNKWARRGEKNIAMLWGESCVKAIGHQSGWLAAEGKRAGDTRRESCRAHLVLWKRHGGVRYCVRHNAAYGGNYALLSSCPII